MFRVGCSPCSAAVFLAGRLAGSSFITIIPEINTSSRCVLSAKCQHADSSQCILRNLGKSLFFASLRSVLSTQCNPVMAPSSKLSLRFASWYARLAAFNVGDLFTRQRPLGPPRTLYVNESLPQACFDAKGRVKREHVYATNQVITSKYNVITFLPRNLLEQFRRIANMCVINVHLTVNH